MEGGRRKAERKQEREKEEEAVEWRNTQEKGRLKNLFSNSTNSGPPTAHNTAQSVGTSQSM